MLIQNRIRRNGSVVVKQLTTININITTIHQHHLLYYFMFRSAILVATEVLQNMQTTDKNAYSEIWKSNVTSTCVQEC